MIQTIVMTSDKQKDKLPGFFYLWDKYYQADVVGVVCGFTKPDDFPSNWRFVSQGIQSEYPPKRWSERLMSVLDNVADEVFILLLEDYWLVRPTDTTAVKMMHDYMHQFRNVLKFDLSSDRLYANGGGQYLGGANIYDNLGYLDLIKSDYTSPYHLSLWGGMWQRDLLRKLLVYNETAQEIEINGTRRLAEYGDEILVLGTRQVPMWHINAVQGASWNYGYSGLNVLREHDKVAVHRKFNYDFDPSKTS